MPGKPSDGGRWRRGGHRKRGARAGVAACVIATLAGASVAVPVGRLALAARFVAAQVIPPTCAWRNISSAARGNMAYPDGAAASWTSYIYARQGLLLHIRGDFPYARFMSFTVQPVTLSPNGGVTFSSSGLAHLQDMQIAPDAGSVNPFRPGGKRVATPRRYGLWVRFHAPQARSPGNTLFAASTGLSALTYRIYAPDKGRDALGGVPLPTIDKVMVRGDGGAPAIIHVPLCAPIVPLRATALVKQLAATVAGWPAGAWHPSSADAPTTPDSGHDYGALVVHLARQPGLVVVRFKAPSFAHTYSGGAITGHEQVRYWSLCAYDLTSGRLAGCVDDYQANLDRQGFATIVIGAANQQPLSAGALARANWLTIAAVGQAVLIYRQLLGAPDFHQFVDLTASSAVAMHAHMGAYYPTIVSCVLPQWTATRCSAHAS